MPYSLDLRKRAVSAVHDGTNKSKVCRLFSICRKTLYSWLELEKSSGNLEPQTGFQKGHSHGINDLEEFRRFVDINGIRLSICNFISTATFPFINWFSRLSG